MLKMAKKESLKEKKVKELLSELSNSDIKRQLKAVKSLKIHGNETVIEPLLIKLSTTENEELSYEISDLLNTIKSTRVPEKIADALIDKRFSTIRQTLLASIWNSGLDYRPYLKEIVSAATQGEMMDALECITIIENIEGALTEDEIFEPLIVLREYLANNKDEKSAKVDLLKEITIDLQNRNNLL